MPLLRGLFPGNIDKKVHYYFPESWLAVVTLPGLEAFEDARGRRERKRRERRRKERRQNETKGKETGINNVKRIAAVKRTRWRGGRSVRIGTYRRARVYATANRWMLRQEQWRHWLTWPVPPILRPPSRPRRGHVPQGNPTNLLPVLIQCRVAFTAVVRGSSRRLFRFVRSTGSISRNPIRGAFLGPSPCR